MGKARLQVYLKWDLTLSSQMLPLNENMVGFGEVEKIALTDKLKYVGYFHASILVWGLPW